jgi:hypothetical protein
MSDSNTGHISLKLEVSAYGFLFGEFLVKDVDHTGLSLREIPSDDRDRAFLTSLSWAHFCEGYQNGHIELHYWEGDS